MKAIAIFFSAAILVMGGCATTTTTSYRGDSSFRHTVLFGGDLEGDMGIPLTESERRQVARVLHRTRTGAAVRLIDEKMSREVLVKVIATTDKEKCREFSVSTREPVFQKEERTACYQGRGVWNVVNAKNK